jgi:hypothetical protein
MKNKLIKYIQAYGLNYVLSLIVERLLRGIGLLNSIELVKVKVNIDSRQVFGNEIKYGQLKGVKLANQMWWGKYDLVSKYLGQYEKHVIDKLAELSLKYNHFVDIGAADGYFVVGCVKSKMFETATAFEISEKGREVTQENANLNGVGEQIEIEGEANAAKIAEIVRIHGPCVVLRDIEGEEFNLFDDKLFEALQRCAIIIELHDGVFPNIPLGRDGLFAKAEKYFNIKYIERSNSNIIEFQEFSRWTDDFRMLVVSEGRPSKMEWILLEPNKLR